LLEELELDLHDLVQPLMTLQCRLEIAQMLADPHSVDQAVAGALDDAARACACVQRLRDRLRLSRGESAADIEANPR